MSGSLGLVHFLFEAYRSVATANYVGCSRRTKSSIFLTSCKADRSIASYKMDQFGSISLR